MTTSLRVPNLDPSNRPALLSPTIVSLLRNTLHFKEVIVTDSLSMTAVGEPMPRATVDAAVAGNDLLLMSSGSTTLEDEADQMLLEAVTSGQISQAQVQASARRVIALHRRYALISASAVVLPSSNARRGSSGVATAEARRRLGAQLPRSPLSGRSTTSTVWPSST